MVLLTLGLEKKKREWKRKRHQENQIIRQVSWYVLYPESVLPLSSERGCGLSHLHEAERVLGRFILDDVPLAVGSVRHRAHGG